MWYKLFIALLVDGDTIIETDEFDASHTFYLLVVIELSFENGTFVLIVLCLIICGIFSLKNILELKGWTPQVYFQL